MPVEIARILVAIAATYLAVGILLLPWWMMRGLRRLDKAAADASPYVKALLAPGLVALWPLLLRRGLSGSGHPPAERNSHRRAAGRAPAIP